MVMYRKERSPYKKSSQIQVMAISGMVAASLFVFQMNLQEALRMDRFLHSSISLILFLVFFSLLKGVKGRVILAGAASLAIGAMKEWSDSQMQVFDMYANIFGVFLALAFVFMVYFFVSDGLKVGSAKGVRR